MKGWEGGGLRRGRGGLAEDHTPFSSGGNGRTFSHPFRKHSVYVQSAPPRSASISWDLNEKLLTHRISSVPLSPGNVKRLQQARVPPRHGRQRLAREILTTEI
ncbi:hypothetical protein E2C01_015405 [Portunus trituberculatus]|uniref:Uncharacterized protein n=1 Tax=Portunus trituberculatus TaxID=210409 RepID=A0A5B7DLF2_PORTR|nr:hypothetical protein [Portunus trituberculatus]